jgi:hypothetical protein
MNTKCFKCGYESEDNFEKFKIPLCKICYKFAPNDEILFKEYINEKLDFSLLETFRKFHEIGNIQKKSMIEKAKEGEIMSRPPFGYDFKNGKLVPAQNFREVEEIFEEFLNKKISLNQLAKKHSFSVNGIKKILKNFTYLGKVKFNNNIYEGKHDPLISSTLFNHVQNKLERLGIK